MTVRSAVVLGALISVSGTTCSAQIVQQVQLPTFQFFTVSTTVSVPDSGGAFLGGVRRGQHGMTSRGAPGLGKVPGISRLFSNRGRGSSLASSGASVTATIIDHEEMDVLLLGEAAGRRPTGTALTETDRKALILSSHVGRSAEKGLRLGGDAPRESVAAIHARHDDAARAHDGEMMAYWERGQQAESLKRWGAARVCYDVIARRSSGPLRQQAIARLARLRTLAKPAPARTPPPSNVAKTPAAGSTSRVAKPGPLLP